VAVPALDDELASATLWSGDHPVGLAVRGVEVRVAVTRTGRAV
jgi:hemin uptake protein HemP